MPERITWEDTRSIALRLIENHPKIEIENLSLGIIYQWTMILDGFDDEPELANDQILMDILQEWYEEVNPI